MTINPVKINGQDKGYIVVSEIANDILIAVEERKNFILRTVFLVALVILVFSVLMSAHQIQEFDILKLLCPQIVLQKNQISIH